MYMRGFYRGVEPRHKGGCRGIPQRRLCTMVRRAYTKYREPVSNRHLISFNRNAYFHTARSI